LGFVSAEDLPLLYSGARAFVYPSHYEGFGIPVLEAMACACPVICSTGSSLDEISGNAALQVDTQTPEALSDALNLLASDDARTAEMKDKGIRQAATFSWKRCAEQTLAVYQDVLGL
jgi:glycosyltransferase involved in cell wall biosynthesis